MPIELNGSQTLDALRREAEAYLEHRWYFFNQGGLPEPSIDWHFDPLTGVRSPRTFAFDIDHRKQEVVGNIKYLWEKSRHHHLTILAAGYYLWRDERYAKEVADQILDWIDQNPYLHGVHWSHPLEHGIRLISWVWCERWLRGSEHYDRVFGPATSFWHAVWLHQQFIAASYSQGSSANNHLIGEMAGLYVSSVAWPLFPESKYWTSFSQHILEREAAAQTFESGLNREMAFSYHVFVLEFLVLTLVESERADRAFSSAYHRTIRRMAEAMSALTDVGGNLPRYGDGDEGRAIQFQAHTERRDEWLLHVAAALTDARVPVTDRGAVAGALLGVYMKPTEAPRWLPERAISTFEDAGIYALVTNPGLRDECFVLADAGPHGFLSIAAHAHADALSFTLSLGGIPILIDPGTYAYHTDEAWRSYFRSTAAHNTVVIDHSDQSRQAGAFLWTSKATTTVTRATASQDEMILCATHDGYRSLGVRHERTFTLAGTVLQLTDMIYGEKSHDICLWFHFAPGCVVRQLDSHTVEAWREGRSIIMELPPNLDIVIHNGSDEGGWFSPCFGIREKSFSLAAHGVAVAPIGFTTKITMYHAS